VAILGAGRWGKNLIRVFGDNEASRIVAICDTSDDRLRAYRAHPTARLYPNIENAARDVDIDAVVIAAPSSTHFTLALQSLELGKHVFVEKPITLSSSDSAKLVLVAQRTRRRVMVGHVLRYHPAVLELGSVAESGRLGTLRAIRCERRGPAPASAEGLWWSVSPHDVSVARWLFREDARTISAQLSRTPSGAERTTARLLYSRSRSAAIVASCSTTERFRRVELSGTRGFAVLEDTPLGASLTVFDGRPGPLAGAGEVLQVPPREPLACEADHFVRAILHETPIATDAEEGHRVVQTLEAGSTSMSLGGIACPVGGEARIAPQWGETDC
jgi:UDP-2-acetamido-3-amino-2,3-dideoxy-glucuronate N-acetyltransferase